MESKHTNGFRYAYQGYPRNAWYVIGFSHELAKPFACVYQSEHLQALRLSPDAPAAGEVIYSAAFAGLD